MDSEEISCLRTSWALEKVPRGEAITASKMAGAINARPHIPIIETYLAKLRHNGYLKNTGIQGVFTK